MVRAILMALCSTRQPQASRPAGAIRSIWLMRSPVPSSSAQVRLHPAPTVAITDLTARVWSSRTLARGLTRRAGDER